MSEENNEETHSTEVNIIATLKKEETGELEATPKVSAEKLRKAQLLDEINSEVSIARELPKRRKPTAKIPDKGELGKKFTVKLDKRYDKLNLKVYQGEELIETGGGNTNIVHDGNEKGKDEISYDFFDPVPLQGKTLNGLTKGKYFVVVYAHGTEQGDELTQEQVVDVE